jgi:hypothetical protein
MLPAVSTARNTMIVTSRRTTSAYVIWTDVLSTAHCVVHDDTASRPTPNWFGLSGSLKASVKSAGLASVTVIVASNPVWFGIETGRAPVSPT